MTPVGCDRGDKVTPVGYDRGTGDGCWLWLRLCQRLDFGGLWTKGSGFYFEGDQLAATQRRTLGQGAAADEDFAAVGGGDEAEAFAPVVPFDRAALALREGQQMATAGAVGWLDLILLLFPACPDEADAAVLAGEGAVG